MHIIDHVIRRSELPPDCAAYRQDTLTLGWEDRVQAHGRRRSDGGRELGLSLPRGTVLRDGDWLILDADRVLIRIVERPEPVFVIAPRAPAEWALYAYHIGNRHQPAMISDRGIVCPDVPGVEQLLVQHRIPYERATLAFTPVTGSAGHQH
jgi:urease accessory protein